MLILHIAGVCLSACGSGRALYTLLTPGELYSDCGEGNGVDGLADPHSEV